MALKAAKQTEVLPRTLSWFTSQTLIYKVNRRVRNTCTGKEKGGGVKKEERIVGTPLVLWVEGGNNIVSSSHDLGSNNNNNNNTPYGWLYAQREIVVADRPICHGWRRHPYTNNVVRECDVFT